MNTTGMSAVLRALPQMRERGRAVHHRHHDVEQDEVGRPGGRRRQRVAAGAAAAHREIGIEAERQLDDLADVGLVVDVQDADRAHATSFDRRAWRDPPGHQPPQRRHQAVDRGARLRQHREHARGDLRRILGREHHHRDRLRRRRRTDPAAGRGRSLRPAPRRAPQDRSGGRRARAAPRRSIPTDTTSAVEPSACATRRSTSRSSSTCRMRGRTKQSRTIGRLSTCSSRSVSTGFSSQSSTLSVDERWSSRPRLGSAETTTIGVLWYCGWARRCLIRLMPSLSGNCRSTRMAA